MIRSTTPSCVASSASSSRPPPATSADRALRQAPTAASDAIRASTAFECAARRRAAQQHRVAGLQAQRGGVDRHVRPRLVDHGDHAQRDSNLAEVEPVRPGARRPRPRRPGPAARRSPARRRRSSAPARRRAPAGPSARPRARSRARPRGRARWPRGSPGIRASRASAIACSAAFLVADGTVASRRAAALAARARSVTEVEETVAAMAPSLGPARPRDEGRGPRARCGGAHGAARPCQRRGRP